MLHKIKNIYHLVQAFIAALFFNFPSKSLTVIGVTGTDGKTTTVNMIYHILKSSGQKVSMVSSIGAKIAQKSKETGYHVSTPSPWQVQKLLKLAVDFGSKYFVIEATSHGLDQNRLAFINFEVGVMTNITAEHLDYHKTWASYAQAKAKLLANAQTSVINMDDKSFLYLKPRLRNKILTYSLDKKRADYNLKKSSIVLQAKGNFNLSNALASLAAVSAIGITRNNAANVLKSFKLPEGRMQEINTGQKFKAIVDFAHTPNALRNALETLKSDISENGRLITLFGAASQRWEAKREAMGTQSAKIADLTIITSEDPREEDPGKIANQIASGLIKSGKRQGKDFYIILNRAKAIKFAVGLAREGDTIGFFGKGHEKSMNVGGKELPWDEVKQVEIAIKALK